MNDTSDKDKVSTRKISSGDKVRYTGRGYADMLSLKNSYTVQMVMRKNQDTFIELKGIPEMWFNIEWFQLVPESPTEGQLINKLRGEIPGLFGLINLGTAINNYFESAPSVMFARLANETLDAARMLIEDTEEKLKRIKAAEDAKRRGEIAGLLARAAALEAGEKL